MRILIILVLAALPAFATDYVSNAAGLCTDSTKWTPNGVPADGDRITLAHAMTSCGITIGRASTNDTAGTGTVSSGGATTLVGSGTAFLTELAPGMSIFTTGATIPTIIASVTNDTSATLASNLNTGGSKSFTIRDYAVYLKTGGSLTVQPSGTLTLHGDYNSVGRTTTFTDANIIFDSATQHYRYLGAGLPLIQALAGAGRASISATTAYGTLTEGGGGNTAVFNNVDFSNLGDATHSGITLAPSVAFKLIGCTFTSVGNIGNQAFSVPAATDMVITGNRLISLPTGLTLDYAWLAIPHTTPTTGLRLLMNNMFAVSTDAHPSVSSQLSAAGYTVTGNVFNSYGGPNFGGPLTLFKDNLIYFRAPTNNTNANTFLGCGGDTHNSNYIMNDEGDGEAAVHSVMAADACTVGGTWTATGNVYDVSGQPSANALNLSHPSGAPTQNLITQYDHNLILPNYKGNQGGLIQWRGTALTPGILDWNTGTGTLQPSTAGTAGGVFTLGASFAGFTNMITEVKNNLEWSKSSTFPGAGTGNMLVTYGSGTAPTDTVTNSGVANNAYYNATSGQMCDSAGANCLSVLGWGGFRQTTPLASFTGDLDLGTGTDERTQGPRFGDPTRNFATFDSAYLGHTASAWVDGHSYVIGNTVSASTSTFYGGATINYRCVKDHSSDATSATKGKPGSAVTMATSLPPSGYRVNWEFASFRDIADGVVAGSTITDGAIGCVGCTYIQALTAWVKRGFTPQAPVLWCGATDGTSIGAVDFCAKGKAMLSAIAF